MIALSCAHLSWQFSISLERFVRWVLRPKTPSSASSRNSTSLNLDRSLCDKQGNGTKFNLSLNESVQFVLVCTHSYLSRVQLTDVLLTSHR